MYSLRILRRPGVVKLTTLACGNESVYIHLGTDHESPAGALTMLTAVKNFFNSRRDRRAMLNMRAVMSSIHVVLFPESELVGTLVRVKTGLALEQRLENRLGIMGPDFFKPVTTDYELEREAKVLDNLPPVQLAQLSDDLGRVAERTLLERGSPEEWSEGEDTKNAAYLIALRLLSGWLKCKVIMYTSMNRKVIKEARDLESLHLSHIRRLLRLKRGEKAIQEGDA